MLAETDDARGDSESERCKSLWRHVLRQAVCDALGSDPYSAREKPNARAFCLAERGQWAESRELICSLADVDPQYFSERVKALDE